MTLTQIICPNSITLRTGKKEVRSAEAGTLVPVFEKPVTEFKLKPEKNYLNAKAQYI